MPDVLFVAPDLHGGVGRCVAFIADALPERGVDAALFLLRSRNREYPVANPRVTRALPVIESPASLRLMLPVAFWRLLRQIRRDRPAIVCSHGLLCNMLVVLAKKLLRGKFATVAFEHSSPAIHYGASRMRRLKCWLVSQTYRRHDAVVGVSRGVKEDLVSMFPPLRGKVHTIYNGVPLDNVRRQGAQPKTADGGDSPYHVVAVGRLEAVKDYATLIDAAMPMVLLRAADFGLRGDESPAGLDANPALLTRLERIRREAGARMGLGDVSNSVIPKPVLLAPGGDLAILSIRSRYFTPHACHRAHAATGAVGVAAAFLMPGTVAHDCGGPAPRPGYRGVRIEHPSGGMDIDVRLETMISA